MRPVFKISADGREATQAIRKRLVSLRVTDQAGWEADTMELVLDDGDTLQLPRTGTRLDLVLGYDPRPVEMGSYIVDELALSAPPATLTVRAKAAPVGARATLKACKSRSFQAVTLDALARMIAAEHGLTAKVAPELSWVTLTHLEQTEESDLHLLTRLAERYDALAKVAGEQLLLVKRGAARAASGLPLAPVTLAPGDVTLWRVSLTQRESYPAAEARYHDPQSAEWVAVRVGTGQPVLRLRWPHANQAEAEAAAQSALARANRGTARLSLELPGRPELAAETPLTLEGFREGTDGEWVAVKVDHLLDGGGYRTGVEAEQG